MTDIRTANEFRNWLGTKDEDDAVIYHRGFLARGKGTELLVLANAVWKAAVDGRVYLTQRRVAYEVYEYMATKPLAGTLAPLDFRPLPPDAEERRAAARAERIGRIVRTM